MNNSISTSAAGAPEPHDKALILVESSFQLLCAYETISRYSLDYVLALRMTGVGRNDEQLKRTAAALGVRYVEVVARVQKIGFDMLSAWPILLPLLTRRYKHLFLGSYFSRFIRILRRGVRAERIWIIDDGLATLLAQAEMVKSGVTYDLVTCLELPELPNQTILHHKLESILALNSVNYTDRSLFIGQPFVEMSMMRKEDYDDILAASREASKSRLTYVPHRAENAERVAVLQRSFDVDIQYPITCIELDLVREGKIPRQVFSVMSTAAFTIARMFPETTVTIFPSLLEGVDPQQRETVDYARTIRNMKISETDAATRHDLVR